jgi:hypothetical protein
MSTHIESRFRWFLWLGVAIIVVVATIAALILSKTTTPRPITLRVDTNGVTRLGAVPLLTTNIRDGTFSAMGALGLKASLTVPPLTNGDPRGSNVLETLQSMSKAGLFSTNQPRNPYE